MDFGTLTTSEKKLLKRLNTPFRIQEFLDKLPYRSGDSYLCPLQVLRRKEAHCFDGSIFAAALLERLGHQPFISYLVAHNDDDHLLALYKRNECWGAVSKSNYSGLRSRDPVYRTLRELVMSYFEPYYNIKKQKTLRGYTSPLILTRFNKIQWRTSNQAMEVISDALDDIRIISILTPAMARTLSPVDERSYRAGLLGSKRSGIYRPR